jgi:uncharacterized membrane protein YeaQ/YmgE (transglycosylase-associated protein family)
MSILGWIVLGAFSGWLASVLTSRNRQMGWLANVIVGIIGAGIGGAVFHLFGGTGVTGFNLPSLGVALVGSIILLIVVNLLTGRRRG